MWSMPSTRSTRSATAPASACSRRNTDRGAASTSASRSGSSRALRQSGPTGPDGLSALRICRRSGIRGACAHRGEKASDQRASGLSRPRQAEFDLRIRLVDDLEYDAGKADFSLALLRERDTEACGDETEHRLFA